MSDEGLAPGKSRILFEGFITACQHHIAEKQRL